MLAMGVYVFVRVHGTEDPFKIEPNVEKKSEGRKVYLVFA